MILSIGSEIKYAEQGQIANEADSQLGDVLQ